MSIDEIELWKIGALPNSSLDKFAASWFLRGCNLCQKGAERGKFPIDVSWQIAKGVVETRSKT